MGGLRSGNRAVDEYQLSETGWWRGKVKMLHPCLDVPLLIASWPDCLALDGDDMSESKATYSINSAQLSCQLMLTARHYLYP